MNATEARTLKPGERVQYLDRPAVVQSVARNGVVVSFYVGPAHDQRYVTERVAARNISRAA